MKEVKKILICGGGMMGSAIAQVLAGLDDVTITVYDKFPVDIEAKIRNNMKLLVEKEIVTPADVDKVISKISFTQDIESEGVKNADLVVECVLEDMQLKQVLKQFRNQCETSQEEIYQLARSKQYYVPAAKATAEEIQHVRSVLSQG